MNIFKSNLKSNNNKLIRKQVSSAQYEGSGIDVTQSGIVGKRYLKRMDTKEMLSYSLSHLDQFNELEQGGSFNKILKQLTTIEGAYKVDESPRSMKCLKNYSNVN